MLSNRKFVKDGTTFREEYDIVLIPEPPKPTLDDIEKMLSQNIQSRLDTFAQSKKYNDILSACSYINDTNTTYANEANYCIQVRSQTWNTFAQIIENIKSGARSMPLSYIEIENELPTLEWPE